MKIKRCPTLYIYNYGAFLNLQYDGLYSHIISATPVLVLDIENSPFGCPLWWVLSLHLLYLFEC